MNKGIIYYTDNMLDDKIAEVVRKQIIKVSEGIEIISVSLKPIDFGKNAVIVSERSVLTMFRQILLALEMSTVDFVYFCEHDVLYTKSHFDFVGHGNVYYYNMNWWKVNAITGKAVSYTGKQVSGLCGYRHLLIEHYRKRVDRVLRCGYSGKLGYEPGLYKSPRGIDDYEVSEFRSTVPLIDIRHSSNLTSSKFSLRQFKYPHLSAKNWTESDSVPLWGKTKGRFQEFLEEI